MYVSHPTMQPSKMKALRHGTICKDTFIFQNSANSMFICSDFSKILLDLRAQDGYYVLFQCYFKNTFCTFADRIIRNKYVT